MRRGSKLSRSTPFRLALAFSGLFVLVFIVSGAIVYQTMSSNISERLDETILQAHSVLAASYGSGDLEDLVTAVESNVAFNREEDQVYWLTGPDGKTLAGNISARDLQPGFQTLSASELGIKGDREGLYRVWSGQVGPNMLIVGFGYSETDELKMLVLTGFGWATAIAAILSIAGGTFLATRVQQRLDTIASTMMSVSNGALTARIPLTGNDDDIDTVSAQVNAALERLAGLVEGMRQVSSDIAHDLKTPLNRLHIALEAIARKKDDAYISDDLAEAQSEIESINATFEALLRIAQIEAGARKERFTRIDLNAVVEKIADIYEEVAADQGKTLKATRAGKPAFVMGDADLLTQLFANLVENALRHCPAGTTIEINVAASAGAVSAEVRDDGPGIPEEEREKVFRRLYRMDKSRSTPGSGLGLSMTKAIADLHDADIKLHDAAPGLRVALRFR